MIAKLELLFMLVAAVIVLHGVDLVAAAPVEDSPAQGPSVDHVSEGTASGDRRSEDPGAQGSTQTGNGHDSLLDCTRCHERRPEPTQPDTTKLLAPVPQLCSACHKEHAAPDGWVHGPVAAGDCLLCHDPHRSEHRPLLRQPVPALCHACHTVGTLLSIEGHADESHGRCIDCHESHAGANRTLLKQKFLDSQAGARYADEPAYRRRPYVFIDGRSSLAGLRGVRVIPVVERLDLLGRYGVTPEAVKTEVERCLRAKGIRILPDEGQVTERPGLYISLRMVELRLPSYSGEVCALSGSLGLLFRQTVEVVGPSGGMERRLCLAATWDTSAVVVWSAPKVREGLANGVKVLVDRFSSDYLEVNPGERPSSSRHGSPGSPEHHAGE